MNHNCSKLLKHFSWFYQSIQCLNCFRVFRFLTNERVCGRYNFRRRNAQTNFIVCFAFFFFFRLLNRQSCAEYSEHYFENLSFFFFTCDLSNVDVLFKSNTFHQTWRVETADIKAPILTGIAFYKVFLYYFIMKL